MKLTKICLTLLLTTGLVTGCKFGSSTSSNGISDFGKSQEAHFALADNIASLDPRLAHGLAATNVSRMLFEGLTYIDEHGKIFPGIAVNIQISNDLKTYTFVLRDAKWSNGDPVKASDFEYSWKTSLNPEVHSPMAHMLFAIRGAQMLFEGKVGADEVGIHALDDKTLVVNLENPSPYFLQLTATAAYFPVHQKWAEEHPDFKDGNEMRCICNGPFRVEAFVPSQKLDLMRNIHYWGNAAVKLDKAHISFMDDAAALAAFQSGEIDWVGSPLSTLGKDGIAQLKQDDKLLTAPAAGTQFLRLNVEKAPFNNQKIRQALMLACDTQAIVANIMQGPQKPARALVPPAMGLQEGPVAYDTVRAALLFEEGLLDMTITRNDLPSLTLSYIASDRMQKLAEAITQNWKSVLNIDIALESSQAPNFYDKLFAQNYDIAAGSWFADYFDPMSFLSIFYHKDNGINCTGWANLEYTNLLDQSNLEIDPTKRMAILQKAQDVLLADMPILPLFHFAFAYGKKSTFEHADLSPMGLVDVEDAYFNDKVQ